MKQVVQSFRTGELTVADVPSPALRPNGMLVRTIASAVSAGTEKSKVELARKSLAGKALARPDQVRQVLDTLKREGVRATYDKVANKLDRLSPLGYSISGRVVAVGAGCEGFSVGDPVACAGAGYANHAELVWAPANLCAAIPAGVAFEAAAFATIGAIALQGVRQAEARFGETIVVIGLGLIGQLSAQLLRASGCRVIGIDVDPWKVALADGFDAALHRDDDVVGHTLALTDGRGADAVIITAASSDNDPVVLAGELARDRAHVVIVGAVPIDVPRSPYYEKELDVRLSRSYGPGRYDRAYEERGVDYPAGYVRWTENRNMQAFLHALAANQVKLDKLVTHRFAIDDAARAYDLLESDEPYLGVALRYAEDAPIATTVAVSRAARGRANLGLIGAGSFAGGKLLPILKSLHGVAFAKVATASGLTAKDVAARHGFAAAVGSADDILDDDAIDTVVIATRHDTHAELAARALARGKAVFVEKPLAITREELARVITAAAGSPGLAVGFNRRFSPHTEHLRAAFAGVPGALAIHIRINAGAAAPDSWAHDDGGRLLGEGCHFIDLAHAIAGSPIARVHAVAIGQPDPGARLRDNAAITLAFANGSIATILYTAKGDPASGKERIEVFGGGVSATIDDFTTTTIVRGGRSERYKTTQDKGHRAELVKFIEMATAGAPPPVALDELRLSSLAAIAVLESLDTGATVELGV